MNSQCNEILNHLQTRGPINPVDALFRYGCMRLGARIWDLRHEGYKIDKVMKPGTARNGRRYKYAEYRLAEEQESV